jgi:rare lipoprotein A (peptidoglycan hydrolase)
VRVVASEHVSSASRRVKRVHGFRKSHASYFGPGLYGSALACGGRLSPSTKGVAHKTLPCGTRVTLRYGNRQVTTKVVDRGPYIAGRDWDLTTATRNQLGFGDVGQVMVDH